MVISLQRALVGTFFGLIPLIVVAAMFITAEYRRGLIRVSLTAAPRRGRLLAAKAVVIGAVGFVAGLVAATLALAVGTPMLRQDRHPGMAGFAAHRGTDGRRHRGAARRGRGARARDRHHRAAQRAGGRRRHRGDLRPVPARLRPGSRQRARRAGGGGWALRITPAAALSVQQAVPQFYQVTAGYARMAGTTRSRRGRGWRWSARGRPPRWRWPSTCCAGGTHEPHGPGLLRRLIRWPGPAAAGGASEWTKLRTVAGPAWLLAGVVALTVAVGAAAASAAQCPSATCGIDPAKVSFTGIYPGQAVAAVAGVLAIGNEYSTGMIKLSLTAMPRRLTWFFAKAAVLTAPVLTASALAVAGAALAGRLILPGHGFTPAHGYASLTAAADFRAAAGAVVYLTLIALLSLGVAAAVRDSAAAIGLVLGLLYLFPIARGRHLRPDPRPAPAADRPPARRPGRPGHDRGEQPAAHPVAGPRRRRPLDRRRPPPRRTRPEIPRRMTPYTVAVRCLPAPPGRCSAGPARSTGSKLPEGHKMPHRAGHDDSACGT